MSSYALPTRRMVIKDMGKAGLALVVFGAAACASETTPGTSDAATTPGSTGTTGTPTTTGAVGASSLPPGTVPAEGHQWARANMGFVSAYVLYRDGEAAVVDTGVPGSEGIIARALSEVGLGWDTVGHVVVTHKHDDHQGSLDAILAAAPDASWYAGAGDMSAISAARAGTAVGDGDRVFDLDIIETPGHTPGHLCVLDPLSGILVTGDAARGEAGGVSGPTPQFTEDVAQANQSITKLAGFDYEVILFGHGDPVLTGGSAAMAALAASLG